MNVLELLQQWPLGATDWLLVGLGISLAYIVFGIAGFGTALVAGPILILFMPLSKIVPLLVLLDFVAAFGNLLPSRRDVAKSELLRLLPCMAVGCTLGVIFLLPMILFPVLGVMPLKNTAAEYSNEIVYLFFAGFIFGKASAKSSYFPSSTPSRDTRRPTTRYYL